MGENYFGLGFVLNVEDNASQVFGRVSSSMQQLMTTSEQTFQSMNIAGMSLSQLGVASLNAGDSLLRGIVGAAKNMLDTGDDFEKTRLTMEAMYKSAEVGEKKMRWLMDFSLKTPFEINDLKSAMIGMKAIGIDADQMVTSVSGYRQELMGFIGDLGALRPDVGMQRITYAIRNALGGNIRSLNMVLDIDSEKVLGRKFGKSGDNAKDIADLVSKMNAEGLMNKLNGTWSQMISNMKDTATKFWLAISDGGAFNKAKDTLKYISDRLNALSMDEAKMKRLGIVLSDAFNMIWKPIDWVVRRIVDLGDAIVNLTETHPLIAKVVLGFMTFSGVALLLTGAFFKMSGGILMTLGGLGMLATTLMKFGGISNILKLIGGAFSSLISTILPIIAVIGLVFLAWKTNFLGIREMSITFVNNTRLAFQEANRIANLNSKDMGDAIDKLNTKTFFGGLTLALVKLQVLWSALTDAFLDNTLSDENFEKARKLGLLPLISTILDAKNKVIEIWGVITKFVQGIATSVSAYLPTISKVFKTTFGIAKDVVTFVVQTIISFIKNIWDSIQWYMPSIQAMFQSVWTTIQGVIQIGTQIMTDIIVPFITMIWSKFQQVLPYIKNIFVSSFNIMSSIAGIVIPIIVGLIKGIFDIFNEFVIPIIKGFIDVIKVLLPPVVDTVTSIATDIIKGVSGIIDVFEGIIGAVKDAIKWLTSWNGTKPQSKTLTTTTEVDTVSGAGYHNTMLGLSTGGEIQKEGSAILHPNEVVVNGDLTKKLRAFLDEGPQSKLKAQNVSANNTSTNTVKFEQGSIQITMTNGNETDINNLVNRIAEKLQKKQQMSRVRNYQPV